MDSPISKKEKDDGTSNSEDEVRNFDVDTNKFLEEILVCQNKIAELNEQASEEIINVEQRYNYLRKPHFKKRSEYICKVPEFWQVAFNNHPDLKALITEREQDCFQYLANVEVEESEDIKSGYRIEFQFKENPYFENTTLAKEFWLRPIGTFTSLSTTIQWKDGMDLTAGNEPAYKRYGKEHRLEQRSFFSWYNNHLNPMSDSVAEIIKDDLYHNPLQYYYGSEVENGEEEDVL